MTNDFDTRRVGEIAMLEENIRVLQSQVKKHQADVDKWVPRVTGEMDSGGQGGRVTMAFGGRTLSVKLPMAYLKNGDATTNTTSVLEAFAKSLLIDQLRTVVEPEVSRLMKNAESTNNAGKW